MTTQALPSLKNITIHHTGFAEGPDSYGKRTLKLHGDTLEELGSAAFEITNSPHIEREDLDAATVSLTGRCYSLSVGDIIEVDGEYAMVAPIGFTRITADDFKRLFIRWDSHLESGEVNYRWEMGFHGVRYLAARAARAAK